MLRGSYEKKKIKNQIFERKNEEGSDSAERNFEEQFPFECYERRCKGLKVYSRKF